MLVVAGWVVAERGVDPGAVGVGGEVDVVVALVGDSGRLAPAEAVAQRTGTTLAISQRLPESEYYGVGDRQQRCADGTGVVCFVSEPVTVHRAC